MQARMNIVVIYKCPNLLALDNNCDHNTIYFPDKEFKVNLDLHCVTSLFTLRKLIEKEFIDTPITILTVHKPEYNPQSDSF